MTSPLPFPDWVPLWVHLVMLVAFAGLALLFVVMPFSVFGVKNRLELIEARLDDIQAELRYMSKGPAMPAPDNPAQDERFGTFRAQVAGGLPHGVTPDQAIRAEPRLSRAWTKPPAVPMPAPPLSAPPLSAQPLSAPAVKRFGANQAGMP